MMRNSYEISDDYLEEDIDLAADRQKSKAKASRKREKTLNVRNKRKRILNDVHGMSNASIQTINSSYHLDIDRPFEKKPLSKKRIQSVQAKLDDYKRYSA